MDGQVQYAAPNTYSTDLIPLTLEYIIVAIHYSTAPSSYFENTTRDFRQLLYGLPITNYAARR